MPVMRKAKAAKPAEPHVSPEALKRYYTDMLLIRRFEERAGQMYGMGLIGGFCHLYIGQEAVVVGMQAALKEGDTIITSYRDHGHMLACGMDAKGVMAELTGRRGGYSHGKGGSMHMFSREKNFYGGHGIVGAQVPIGTGLAFAHRYREDGRISVTYLGDGAINQGQVYESFNMAALWKLPVVYVIENNRYGMGTSVSRASARTDLFHRGVAYGIPGEQVDGMDVVAVHEAGLAAGRARPFRQRADHPRNADLPLSRPLDVRSGQVPHEGRSRSDAHRARSDLATAPAPDRRARRRRKRAAADRAADPRHRRRGGAIRPGMPRAGPGRIVDRCAGRSLDGMLLYAPEAGRAPRSRAAGRDAEERMTSEVLMPALSPTMTEGKIARWIKSEGDTVRAGDVLAEIETDKATMEVEAVDEGVLAKIVIPEGTDHVAVNTPIALIAENGEDVDEVDGAQPSVRIANRPESHRVRARGRSRAGRRRSRLTSAPRRRRRLPSRARRRNRLAPRRGRLRRAPRPSVPRNMPGKPSR